MKGIIAWFARNHVAANLLMFVMVMAGVAALPGISQKSFPDINIEVVTVSVPYLGAAPEEVEEGVCVRIEEEIQGVEGIETLSSTAAEGACSVGAELISGYDVDRALAEIKNAVDSITTFPAETEKPIVSHYSVRRTALQLALSGDTDERTLKVLGQRLRDEISALPGVTQVELKSARNDEIAVEVSEESLRRHRLRFDEVVAAVRRSSLDRPGGSIKTREGEILLRTKGQAYVGREFEEIVVRTDPDGTRLLLGDVATVRDGFEEEDRFARFDGSPAVLIVVYRIGDQKVIELVETVKSYVNEAQLGLPEGISLTIWNDGSQSLRDRLDILLRNGLNGFILVFVVLSLFLRLRLAAWVSIGVPISFMGALALFPALGISIDVISLFAFILVLGLLVDDAIVVGENVHSHQERAEDPLEAAIVGTQEVSVPVIFGVLTTVAAFLPLLLAPGAMGQIFSGIGLVVVLCLFFSVTESQLVLPTHLGHVRIKKGARQPGRISVRWKRFQDVMSSGLIRVATRGYQPALSRALEWRYTTLAVGVVMLLVTVAVVGSGRVRFSFFPPVESDYVSASLDMPFGAPAAVTAEAIERIEAAALRVKARLDEEYPDLPEPLVKHVMTSVGAQPSKGSHSSSRPASGASHQGEVSLELLSGQGRPISGAAVVRMWREEAPEIAGAESLTFSSALFSAGDPINLRLQSASVDQLVVAADQLREQLEQYPGVFDVNDSFQEGKREIKLAILPSAEVLGLTLDDLASQVRYAFYGAEAQRIQRDREDVRVMVRYPAEQRRSLGDLEAMRIRTPDGSEVPFSTVATVEAGRGYATIRRTDRQRVINVRADIDLAVGNANEVMADLRKNFLPQLLADHPGLRFSVEGEQREQAKLVGGMLRTTGLALILIYSLLAVPLRSYSQPFVIMAVIPFGLVGAIGGHLLMGKGLSMMSIMGVVALSGVVVNASLVMVHYVNTRREQGADLMEAVRSAGVARFRPIVLTSMTTFAGLTPLLLERSVSAQFLIPMAISLGFGVVFSAAITLFLVPSIYLILEDLKGIGRRDDAAAAPATLQEIPLRPASRAGDDMRNAG
jgi:multidrug efflux pump subunit AcrB